MLHNSLHAVLSDPTTIHGTAKEPSSTTANDVVEGNNKIPKSGTVLKEETNALSISSILIADIPRNI